MTHTVRSWTAVVAILLGTAFATSIQAVEIHITSCGAIVPKHAIGIVQNDLDCTGQLLAGLLSGATLDLNGHVVHGEVAVNLARKATVVGPGTLFGSIIAGHDLRKLKIRQVDVVATGWGVFSNSGIVEAEDASFTGATLNAIRVPKVKLTRVDVSGNPVADFAVFASKIRGTEVTANNNGAGGCTTCIALYAFNNAKFTDLQATGNTGYAAMGVSRLQLLDSNVTGNNGRGLGIDVAAGGGLVAINTTCGLSGFSDPPYTAGYWGVCTND